VSGGTELRCPFVGPTAPQDVSDHLAASLNDAGSPRQDPS
jgi:hypothetical protein